MGAWGAGIFEDDLAADLQGEFEDALEAGKTAPQTATELLATYRESLADSDEGPVVYLALASLLLDNGVSAHPVYAQARRVLTEGAGLDLWREQGEETLGGRMAVYRELSTRLDTAGAT